MQVEKRSMGTGSLILAVLALGSAWGLSEVLLNQALRSSGLDVVGGFPLRSTLMTGVALGFLACACRSAGSLFAALGVTGVAVAFKLLGSPLLGQSAAALCKSNSAVGIYADALAFSAVALCMGGRFRSSAAWRAAGGAGAGLAAAALFYWVGVHNQPCANLLQSANFVLGMGVFWAVAGAAAVPVGHLLGLKLRVVASRLQPVSGASFKAVATAFSLMAWAAGAWAVSAGW